MCPHLQRTPLSKYIDAECMQRRDHLIVLELLLPDSGPSSCNFAGASVGIGKPTEDENIRLNKIPTG